MFLGLTAPDGLVMDLYGPCPGRHHDQHMLRESNINQKIRDLQANSAIQYNMYADKGYVDLSHLVAGYHGANVTPQQVQVNGILSLVSVSVEWCFGKVTECQKFLDFPRMQQAQLQPVARYYRLSVILMNAHTCLYGSLTGHNFGLHPPSLSEYFECEN